MAKEIEHKFLVRKGWRPATDGIRIAQGYLNTDPERTVRVRIKGDKGYLTVKGKNQGISRLEFEYEIPVVDVEAMLKLCEQPPIEKERHLIDYAGFTWEVDVFHGANEGLIVAEIEVPTADTTFERPDWITEEVSNDPRYYNSSLSQHPYSQW